MKGEIEIIAFGIVALIVTLGILIYTALPYLLALAVVGIVGFRLFGGHVASNGKWYARKESPRQFRRRHRR